MADKPENETLLKFPCDFPIKIMGRNEADFADNMLALVIRHAPDFDAATMQMRPSSAGKYISLTCTIRATSKQQLDDLYRELTAHQQVLMAL
ncbi:MAG: DUF493 domain-containing protein [Burkholderiales bacterium]